MRYFGERTRRHCARSRDAAIRHSPRLAPMSVATLTPVRHILRSVATTVVPEASSLDAGAWTELDAAIDDAVAKRGERVRRQVVMLLRLVQCLPVVRFGRPFTSLGAAKRTSFLEAIERSPLLLVRRGFWGIRTLIFLAYYTRDDITSTIGYHPSADGWAARGDAVTTLPLTPTLWVEP